VSFLTWLVRAVIAAFILRMVARAFTGRRVQPRRAKRKVERTGGTLVRDPQCGTHVPQRGAVSIGSGGNVTYFCSTDCRDAYVSARRGKAHPRGRTA
jgi:YHS domain-containing protein